MNINVVIPSFKRWGTLAGVEYWRTVGARYVVPESQRDEYTRAVGADRLIVIPDAADGSIVRKRNWILANVPRPLLMIDDDVSLIVHTEGGEYFRKHGRAKQCVPLDASDLPWFLDHGFRLCEEFGARMWGVNVNEDGRNYQQYCPFRLNQVVLGPFQGHLEHPLRFDERVGTKEDYDMAIQQLRAFKRVLRWNKFAYLCEHGTNQGGIVSQRTLDSERRYASAIMRKWGSDIIQYDLDPKTPTQFLNAKRVAVPIKGV